MAQEVKVARVNEIPPGEMKLVELGEEEVVVVANVGGQFFAFANKCSHRGGPLAEGELEGELVRCPWHGGQFNVRTGEAVAPPPSKPIPVYQVRVEGDDVYLVR
jgi:nitrite reductase/ring-hydroxylating ferredoxin subunit